MSANRQMASLKRNASKILYLIRHGQSIANRDYDEGEAYRDAGLTDSGVSQAKGLQKQLEKLDLELVVVSPLTRALQTCQNALPPSYTGPVLVLPEISEICSSYYSCGQTRQVVQPKFPSRFDWSRLGMDEIWWWKYDQNHRCETQQSQSTRMNKFRDFIRERSENRIAVFSHGDFLWEFLGGDHPYLANCQVVPYDF